MTDAQIVRMFWERNEEALSEMSKAYGRYCGIIAFNILGNKEDAEECVNESLLAVWNSIPPNKPEKLRPYIGKIVRNNAIDVIRENSAMKRHFEEKAIDSELAEFSSEHSVEAVAEQHEVLSAINSFLGKLPEKKRKVFVLRYWHDCGVSEISGVTGFSEANVYKILRRERAKLLEYLKKKGVIE